MSVLYHFPGRIDILSTHVIGLTKFQTNNHILSELLYAIMDK